MQLLVSHSVRATIFPTGSTVESPNNDVGRQVLELVEQHAGQFDVGNHSYSHPDFRELTYDEWTHMCGKGWGWRGIATR
jgi:peptidoglycan/xylan/chitin deacetylase (PgdA/CDA1 family)